jgi:hypothetical protein
VVSDAGAIARLSRLRADVSVDARALDERAAELEGLMERARACGGLSRDDLLIVAVNLHAYYTAMETLLERVARLLDQEVPAGANWHRELLLQMGLELPGLRPRVLEPELVADLDELRKFRHFFRNAYVLELDAERTLGHASRVLKVKGPVHEGIARLLGHVDDVIAALAAE